MTSTYGLLITLACLGAGLAHREESVSSCSTIYFQERMLDKMIKYEHSVKSTLGIISAKLEEVSTKEANMLKDIATFKAGQKEEIDAFKVGQKEETAAFKATADDIMKQRTTQNAQFMKAMSFKYDKMAAQTDGLVEHIQAEVQNVTQVVQERISQSPVAFIVRFSSTVQPIAGNTLLFDTVVLNEGGTYSRTDGTYTAPVAGAYMLSAQVCVNSGYYISYQIRGSETTIYSAGYHGESDFGPMCSSVTTIAMLAAGDKVWVVCKDRSSTNMHLYSDGTYKWTMFSGALVHPTP